MDGEEEERLLLTVPGFVYHLPVPLDLAMFYGHAQYNVLDWSLTEA